MTYSNIFQCLCEQCLRTGIHVMHFGLNAYERNETYVNSAYNTYERTTLSYKSPERNEAQSFHQ